jgi:hypothetical protein
MMSTIKRAYADTPDGQIHYRYLLGTNAKSSIIFIHISASSSCWEPLMQLYAPLGYACYASTSLDLATLMILLLYLTLRTMYIPSLRCLRIWDVVMT